MNGLYCLLWNYKSYDGNKNIPKIAKIFLKINKNEKYWICIDIGNRDIMF